MKTKAHAFLAFDLGAGSGRAILGLLKSGRLQLREIYRFPNQPVEMGKTLYWNFPSLWFHVLEGLRTFGRMERAPLDGIGVDTWGSDYALLGPDGRLLGNPIHYRDARTEGVERKQLHHFKGERLFQLTGLTVGRVSSLAQLVAMRQSRAARVLQEGANVFLMIADLFRYFLCGKEGCELTAAGSSQLLNIRTGKWATPLFKTFDLPLCIMPKVILPGTVAGPLQENVVEQTGVRGAPVVAVAGHDTASAAAAVPLSETDTIFISSGTWSVLGIHRQQPITSPEAYHHGFINEFGFHSMLFVKNMTGIYLVENLRRAWVRRGHQANHAEMVEEASRATPFKFFFDLGSPLFFVTEENIEKNGLVFLRMTGQKNSPNRAEWVRSFFEALVFSYMDAVQSLEKVTRKTFKRIRVIGGGSRNALLCQFTADATGREVVAGPAEATAVSNLTIQALTTGHLKNASEMTDLIARSFKTVTYCPKQTERWAIPFKYYQEILHRVRSNKNI